MRDYTLGNTGITVPQDLRLSANLNIIGMEN